MRRQKDLLKWLISCWVCSELILSCISDIGTHDLRKKDGICLAGVGTGMDFPMACKRTEVNIVHLEENSVEWRREKVRQAVIHAWEGYERSAWGKDEVLPVTGEGVDNFGGVGTTILDSVGTLYLLGLSEQYERARNWVRDELDWSAVGDVVIFETVIRALGGLVSTYELTRDRVFLYRAEELALLLAPAFDTPTGIPFQRCFLNVSVCYFRDEYASALLAEAGSLQLELRALDFHSNNEEIHRIRLMADHVLDVIHDKTTPDMNGIPPAKVNVNSGEFVTNYVTLGAPSDSYFEYLAKLWIQGDFQETKYQSRYVAWVEGMLKKMLHVSEAGDTFVFERAGDAVVTKMDHFTCYIPGVLAITVDYLDLSIHGRRIFEELAVNITRTCHLMYSKSPSGLAGEHIRIHRDRWVISGGYELRPEAIEAFFYLWRRTKEDKYREWAWEVFEKIEQFCRAPYGYSTVLHSRARHPRQDNVMHSFVIAETFKYLYLIFSDDDVLPLDTYVFNTEAHPLRIRPEIPWGEST